MPSQQSVVVLSSQVDLCPSPLHIRKKTRRTFYRRVLRKSSDRPYCGSVCGPLDDIINEITGDIWSAPLECNSGLSLLECESAPEALLTWQHPLKAPSTCTVTPLPVSRIPSDQPLTIRKNRNSRSTASDSSAGYPMTPSRDSSRPKPAPGEVASVSAPANVPNTPWPLFDASFHEDVSENDSSTSILCTDYTLAQQALDGIQQGDSSSQPGKRHSSRLRLLANSFPRLRRAGTGDTSGSNASAQTSSPITTSLATQDGHNKEEVSESENPPSDAVVEAFMRKYARNGKVIGSMVARAAGRLPTPFESRCEQEEIAEATGDAQSTPTTLKAAVRVLSNSKLLRREEQQELWVAVEIEGVLHNTHALPDSTIDVIFVVDNGYYISRDCLSRALDTVGTALGHLGRGDRVALYTTHCTHESVTGTIPDMIYPLRAFCNDTEEIFQGLTKHVLTCGTQTWDPPRPNPTMSDVALAVAKSLEGKDIKPRRTHMVLLTPTTNTLHGISKTFPNLYIHQINPAVLPYRHSEEFQEQVCEERCCKNVFISNWAHYQSPPNRIKQIIRDARLETPLGEITNVHMDIRPKKGCEVLEYEGTTDIASLRLGQVHSFFVRVRVTPSETQELDLNTTDPFLSSSLRANNLWQELRNAEAVGATTVHLFSVQVMHQNSLHSSECWNYSESQLLIIKDLGRLAYPPDMSTELYTRQIFHKFSGLDTHLAKVEIEKLAVLTPDYNRELKKQIKCMAGEIDRHKKTLEYEATSRQKLPTRPGPICLTMLHGWLKEMWIAKN